MLISLIINWITDQLQKEQMSPPRFEPGSFMTERERSTNWAFNHWHSTNIDVLLDKHKVLFDLSQLYKAHMS
jgi:hypothetical protein